MLEYFRGFGRLIEQGTRIYELAKRLGIAFGRFKYRNYLGQLEDENGSVFRTESPWESYSSPKAYAKVIRDTWKACMEGLLENG